MPTMKFDSILCMIALALMPLWLYLIMGPAFLVQGDAKQTIALMLYPITPILVACAWWMGRMDMFDQLRQEAEKRNEPVPEKPTHLRRVK